MAKGESIKLDALSKKDLYIMDKTFRSLIDGQVIYQLLISKGIATMEEISEMRDTIIDNTETGKMVKKIENIYNKRYNEEGE